MSKTGISISMQAIAAEVGSRRFTELNNATITIGGRGVKLDADMQLKILKQGVYRAIYLPLYSKHRAKQAQELRQEREDAVREADSTLAAARRVLKARGMNDEQITAAFEKEKAAQLAKTEA